MLSGKKHVLRVLAGFILPACLVSAGCSSPVTNAGTGANAKPHVAAAPAESCVTRVFDRMTLAQRVGQLFLVGIAGDSTRSVAHAVDSYHFGSLLFTGDSTAGTRSIGSAASRIQSLATATAGVRFFVAANQEGGQVQQLAGPGFASMPSELAQGEWSASVLREEADGWGRELRSAGVNLDLAPVMDVVPEATASQNQPIGMLEREFGYDPGTTGPHGAAFIQGMKRAGVAATAKHFPGLGRVVGNTDYTSDVVDTTTTADDPYLRSFQDAIDAGVPFVMVSLATYTRIDPGHLAVFSSRVMRDILRGDLRFTGVIVSDDLGEAAAVADMTPAQRALEFLDAGGDMITSQTLAPAITMDHAVVRRAETDPAFRAEADSAVMRVLSAKQAFGLLPCGG